MKITFRLKKITTIFLLATVVVAYQFSVALAFPSHDSRSNLAEISDIDEVEHPRVTMRHANRGANVDNFRVLRKLPGGGFQLSDESLIHDDMPAMWSANERQVTISWRPIAHAKAYRISRDGRVIDSVTGTSWVDETVNPGDVHNYVIAAMFDSAEFSGGIWGFPVTVPKSPLETLDAGFSDFQAQVMLVSSISKATVQYQTFIPQAKVDVPAVGCQYGSGYRFGGDNRDFLPSGYPYRTKIQAQAGFTGTGTVTLQTSTVGKTTVYNSSGNLVNSATASNEGLKAYRLGASTGSVVDIRFTLAASNPFCPIGNSIQGAFTISVSKSGAWAISSGSHKQMPNHEIYVHSDIGGWVTAYTRAYANPICLINLACPTASIFGNGTY